MIKRLNNYILNSIKVAVIGFIWFILFQVPYASIPYAPLVGKIIIGLVLWSMWSFMVMIVSGQLDGKNSKEG